MATSRGKREEYRMALPTNEQLKYAQEVAEKLGRQINPDLLKDGLKLSMWTKSNRGKFIELFGSIK